jgi:hypothetical protein
MIHRKCRAFCTLPKRTTSIRASPGPQQTRTCLIPHTMPASHAAAADSRRLPLWAIDGCKQPHECLPALRDADAIFEAGSQAQAQLNQFLASDAGLWDSTDSSGTVPGLRAMINRWRLGVCACSAASLHAGGGYYLHTAHSEANSKSCHL